MTPELEDALLELFIEDSVLFKDVHGLMELAVQETLRRCIKVADDLSLSAGNDAAGGMAHVISEHIKRLTVQSS
jgi:hypothetical protein